MMVQEVKNQAKERRQRKYKRNMIAYANWLVKNNKKYDVDAVGEWLSNSIDFLDLRDK